MDDYKQKGTRFYLSFSQLVLLLLLLERELPILVLDYTNVGRGKNWITAVDINVVSFLFFCLRSG
jgi:hypothetical protein